MKNLMVAGVIGLLFFTAVRYYLLIKYRKGRIFFSIFEFIPKYRDEALLFAGQLASIMEILVGIFYDKFNIDVYLKNQLIHGLISQILCYFPLAIGYLLAALIVKIKKL
jgi:hypothetical protein